MSGTPSTPVFPPSGRVNENADVSPVVIIPNTLVVDDVPYMHEFGKLREKLNKYLFLNYHLFEQFCIKSIAK